MNSEQARFILRAFRPGVDRVDAPEFREASEQLRHDPELAAWFAREAAIDNALRAKLVTATPVPGDLRERLLAMPKIVQPRVSGWRRPTWLAAAAAVVLLGVLGLSWLAGGWARGANFAAFREYAVASAPEMPHLSYFSRDLEQVRVHLRSEGAPPARDLPPALAGRVPKGCRVLEWRGRKVTLICFHGNDGPHVDLFVIDEVDWRDAGVGAVATLARLDGLNTASWKSGSATYVVAADLSNEELRRLLAA